MMNGVKTLVDGRSSVREETTERGRTRRDDENVPWWLMLIPAALVTLIFFVVALAILMGGPWPSEFSDSEAAKVQVDLPVIDENEVSETTRSTPAFSR
jgi:hypothetical protein